MANSGGKSRTQPGGKSSTTSSISAKQSKENSAQPSRDGSAADSGSPEETITNEGGLITFSPTGERIRIRRIQKERVTLEKSP